MESAPAFREVQRFRQPWLWALFGGVALLTLAGGSVSWPGILVLGAIGGLLYSLRLQTEVRADGVYIQMWPLHRSARRIPWADIERYESRRYRPLREFGGWGIRWRPGKVAYNVSGDRGVWIERTNGRAVLIGSRRTDEFVRALDDAVR